jgi:aspartate/methionine/tyrosine aminotransferase
VNMGQGFFGYNPPQFVLDAAHDALGKVECNQYSPTKVIIHSAHIHASQLAPADDT